LKQINAKCRLDLYRISIPLRGSIMIIGMDVVNEGKRSIIGLSASYNQYSSQYYSKIYNRELHKDLIKKKEGKHG
jgi:hypothetical protein